MTTIMMVRCKMNDYDAFKQVYDASQELHAEVGIVAGSVYRNFDDPNVVTVHHQFTDIDAAKATAAQWGSDEAKEVWKKEGWTQMDTMEITLLQHVE